MALALWPFIFVRDEYAWSFDTSSERHEEIHGAQQKEMLLVLFYLWYGIEWLVKLCIYRNTVTAYKNVSFEREAYENQYNIIYLKQRKHYAWVKYIKAKKYGSTKPSEFTDKVTSANSTK